MLSLANGSVVAGNGASCPKRPEILAFADFMGIPSTQPDVARA
jgi:hypothetical protein